MGMVASLMASIGLNTTPFKASMMGVQSDAARSGKAISSALGNELNSQLAKFASFTFVEEAIRRTIDYADTVGDLASRLGISTDAVQKWDYALKQNGSSIERAATFFEKMAISRQRAMAGDDKQIDAFKRLGVSVDDLKNKRLEDLGLQIAQAFETGDPQKLIADLRTVGGKAAGELVAAFRDGMAGLMDKAPVMGEETISALKKIADDAKTIWQEFITSIGPGIVGVWDAVKTSLFAVATAFVAAAEGMKVFAREQAASFDLKKMIYNPMGAVADWMSGTAQGASKGTAAFMETAAEALHGRSLQANKEESERIKREAIKREVAGLGGAVEEPEDEKSAKRVAALKERLMERERANRLAEMTTAERLQELFRQRVELANAMTGKSEEDRLKAALQIADIDKEGRAAAKQLASEDERAAKLEGELNAPGKVTRGKNDLNQLQRIGAYVSAPENSIMTATVKSEQHLAEIKKELQQIRQKRGDFGGAEY